MTNNIHPCSFLKFAYSIQCTNTEADIPVYTRELEETDPSQTIWHNNKITLFEGHSSKQFSCSEHMESGGRVKIIH